MNTQVAAPGRQYYIDWVRILAMIGIFFFHNARFYDTFSDWHVKNAATSFGADAVIAFMSQWIMPLFFLIAGAGTYYALKSRKAGEFAGERTLRLFVPLIFGMIVIVVPQAYFQALYQGENLAGYNIFQIYWLYLQTLPDLNWFHLWFLVDLFLFSLITIPLFINGKNSGKSLMSRLALAINKPWAMLLFFVFLLAIIDIFVYPDGYWGYRNGGWNIVAYLLFYVAGYMMFANPRVMETVKKLRWINLGIGIIAFTSVPLFFIDQLADPEKYFGSAAYVFASIVQSFNAWGWLFAILGLGSRYLTKNNKFLTYSNEAVLPFYVLHQTVIISIGFYIVQWSASIGLKYLVISVTSFIAIMLVYEFIVKRVNVFRFLFGMRLKRKKPEISAEKSRS